MNLSRFLSIFNVHPSNFSGLDKGFKPSLLKLSQSKYYKKTKYGYARGWETVKYVQNIRQYYDILVFLDSQDNVINNKEIDDKIPSTL